MIDATDAEAKPFDGRDSGWFARARALGGDGSYKISGAVGLEEQFGQVGYCLRASLRFGW